MKRRGVTIVVHTDGDLNTRQYRLPIWAFEAGKWAALVLGLLVVLFFTFAGPISRAAARVPGLDREVARLRGENARVQQLATALNRAEQNYQQLRAMLGVRAGGGAVPTAAVRGGGSGAGGSGNVGGTEELMRANGVSARAPGAPPRYEPGPSPPSHWPLDVQGFVTRGQVRAGDPAESHPGIDIAVPVGTAVRAAGGGSEGTPRLPATPAGRALSDELAEGLVHIVRVCPPDAVRSALDLDELDVTHQLGEAPAGGLEARTTHVRDVRPVGSPHTRARPHRKDLR